MTVTPVQLLRSGLLEGVALLVAGSAPLAPWGESVAEGCEALGARVARVALQKGGDAEADALAVLTALGQLHMLVIDAASLYMEARADGREAMGTCLQRSWEITRAVALAGFIESERAGRVVLIAPPPGSEWERAARAGLENLARTLSIEWSRYPVTPVCIAPSENTTPGEVAALVAYLASPAGAYFSGCLFDLSGNASASRASERAAKS